MLSAFFVLPISPEILIISILLNKTKIVEIGTKLRAQENQINNSRILLQNLVYEEMS